MSLHRSLWRVVRAVALGAALAGIGCASPHVGRRPTRRPDGPVENKPCKGPDQRRYRWHGDRCVLSDDDGADLVL